MGRCVKKVFVLILIIGVIALISSGCALLGNDGDSDDDGGGSGGGSDFTKITGSGTITLRILGADSVHPDENLMYGASGIEFGQFERVGGGTTVTSNVMNLVLQADYGSGDEDFIFTGGRTIDGVGCIIDLNANYLADDGDWYALQESITVSGNETVTFTYPDDFAQISGSGTITIEVNYANTAHNTKTLMYGASGITFGQFERVGGDTTVSSEAMSLTLQYESGSGYSGDFIFTGGDPVGAVGCIIDVDNDWVADDGDWYAKEENVTISGNETVTFNYPDDFAQISGSGTVTLNINGVNSAHPGEDLAYGASGIVFGGFERTGNVITIDSDDMNIPIPEDGGGPDFLFTGGDTIGFVGCIIDLNGDSVANDGDYFAGRTNLPINGDQTLTFEY